MKKKFLTVALILTVCGSITLTSCIGSFSLTNKVLSWNNSVGNKFVNELVFVAFWILPVYEVTSIADLLVLNSIEFWSGSNPVACGTKAIDTENGRYLVKCDGKGYDVINETSGESVRLDFIEEDNAWAVNIDGEEHVFMSFIDDNHVRMITPEGDFTTVELSERGVLAYTDIADMPAMAKL
ncbi:MAG: DUF3332 domain-containing protein [Muribaculaceae bacterium]|nr:DUF3332 domain-containing protein [Muribaculaceae bacterium]